MIDRRQFIGAAVAMLSGSGFPATRARAAHGHADLARAIARIEGDARRTVGRCGNLIPPMDSKQGTVKTSVSRCAAPSSCWQRAPCWLMSMPAWESLERRIRISEQDVVPYSPVTKTHVGGEGMTLAVICEAAITLSDNTAGNLMLGAIGGPAGLTTYLRSLGDTMTRLDLVGDSLE